MWCSEPNLVPYKSSGWAKRPKMAKTFKILDTVTHCHWFSFPVYQRVYLIKMRIVTVFWFIPSHLIWHISRMFSSAPFIWWETRATGAEQISFETIFLGNCNFCLPIIFITNCLFEIALYYSEQYFKWQILWKGKLHKKVIPSYISEILILEYFENVPCLENQ